MKVVLMQIAVWLLRLAYLPFIPLKCREKAVIMSRQADKPTTDIELLSRDLRSRGVECAVLTKRLRKSLAGGISYALHMPKQMYHMATSSVVIVDGYCITASVLHKKREQHIVQIWHALGAIKKFGWQSVNKEWGNSSKVARVMRLHRNYDYYIAPGRIIAGQFAQGFGMDESRCRILALPRVDILLEPDESKIRKIRKEYPQTEERTNVLYAPTFRKSNYFDVDQLIKEFDFDKYNLIIKKHWLDKRDYSALEKYGVIVDKKFSSQEWMKLCDKVITDYSAIAFEAAAMEKELYFYFVDIEEYRKKIGLNIEFINEATGTYVYADAYNLCRELKLPYEKRRVKAFRDKYLEADLKDCTKKLADFIVSLL